MNDDQKKIVKQLTRGIINPGEAREALQRTGMSILNAEQAIDGRPTTGEFRKMTEGYVIQNFDADGNCIGARFVAGDRCEYTDGNNSPIDAPAKETYFPFEMKQPE